MCDERTLTFNSEGWRSIDLGLTCGEAARGAGSPPSCGRAFAARRLTLGLEEFAVSDDARETVPLAGAPLTA